MRPISSFLSRWKREGATAFSRITDRVNGELGVVFGGHLIRQALGVISSAILARALGPEGLSVFSVVGAAMMMAITIGDFGLSSSACATWPPIWKPTPIRLERRHVSLPFLSCSVV